MATFRPATRKYSTFHASSFRLLFVVSLPGGAKGRHAKSRQNHHLTTFRFLAPKTRLYDVAQDSHHKYQTILASFTQEYSIYGISHSVNM